MNTLEKVQASLDKYNIDGLIVSNPTNRRYLTGFTGTFGVALISKNDAKFITDFRYTEQATNQAIGYEVIENRNTTKEIAKLTKDMRLSTLGFEEEYVSFKQYNLFTEHIDAKLHPISGLIEDLRKLKSQEEITKIKKAAAISDKAFGKILSDLRPGISEMEINNKLELYMREEGATSSSFDMIIASGFRSAMPHGIASNKKINHGDLVTLDFGALYEGYRSDMTRTVAIGNPGSQLKEIYDIVKEALQIGVNVIKDGVKCKQVDTVVRDYITNKGYGENFGHGTGHSFGLEIHEGPYFSQESKDVLQTGMVMTVEPGIYLPGLGGVRIEDDVVVTDSGHEIITNSLKNLIVL
ncbi:M24 family metallopeptidase [Virgibacillus halodenitrificans]|nr:M24 family metallopeptidase [Virgibacillus halodenitrificans]